jgi:alpha-glucosidase
MRLDALLAAVLTLGLPATAMGDSTVGAGRLKATVGADPWHLSFTDSGRPVLDEARATGPALAGTLGYSSGGAWFHATLVTSESATANSFEADLATTNPAGKIHVRIEPDASGVIALTATAPAGASQVGISFDAREHERYLGFGERSNAVDQRGQTIENYVAEGPYQQAERPAIAGFVPQPGYHPRDDATYFPIPWLLSTTGYGVLLDNDERSEFHLASDDAQTWSATVDSPKLRMRVFAGPTPAQALSRFTRRTGRQPPPGSSARGSSRRATTPRTSPPSARRTRPRR